uniref:Major facilitator superfamily (MFS) profile domain-containing protein n=1 Tax=Panagrolaimus sp. JU765 TaxID=591449 RepID=A0AC34QL32_9BILA
MSTVDTITIPLTKWTIRKPILIAYFLCTLHNVAFFSQLMSLPYVAKRLEVNDTLFGHCQTLFGTLSIIGGPIFGFIIKKYGIKNGLYLVYMMTMFMAIILLNINNVYGLFLSRLPGLLIHGMQISQAMLAALTKPGKERTTAFGKIGLCFGMSFVIAPLINKGSEVFFHHSASLYSSILLSLLSISITYFFVDETVFARKTTPENDAGSAESDSKVEESKKISLETIRQISKRENVLTVFLQKNVAVAPMNLPFSVLQLYLIEKFNVTETGNSMVQMAVGMLIMVVNGFGISFLRAKFSEEKLITLGICALTLVHLQFINFVYFEQLFLILPFLAIGMTLVNTVSDSILTASVHHDEQSVILGICTASASFARTIAPSIGGFVLDNYGFSSIGYIGLSGALLALGIGRVFPVKPLKHSENEADSFDAKKEE